MPVCDAMNIPHAICGYYMIVIAAHGDGYRRTRDCCTARARALIRLHRSSFLCTPMRQVSRTSGTYRKYPCSSLPHTLPRKLPGCCHRVALMNRLRLGLARWFRGPNHRGRYEVTNSCAAAYLSVDHGILRVLSISIPVANARRIKARRTSMRNFVVPMVVANGLTTWEQGSLRKSTLLQSCFGNLANPFVNGLEGS